MEGNVKIKIPDNLTISKKDSVFYNPIMEVNRDISVSIIQALLNKYRREEFLICEPLGGSGIRGLRYGKELKNPSGNVKVIIGDINPNATKLAMENLKLNKLDNVSVVNKDANVLLSENFRTFNLVDLDPFGSPNPYIDSAIRSLITKNGILSITATDTAVLCGAYKKACIRNYNAIPLPGDKEMALRLLIGYVIRMGAKYDIGFDVVFSHFTDHYCRAYLITKRGAKKSDESMNMLGYVKKTPLEEVIIRSFLEGYDRTYSGPIYLGPIYNHEIIKEGIKIAKERNYSKRSIDIMEKILNESRINQIGCYDIHNICSNIKELVPPIKDLLTMLESSGNGFKVSRVHHNPNGIKTNGSVKDIIECIIKYNKK